MWWQLRWRKSPRRTRVFKTRFVVWNSSFKDSSSIKRFHYPKQKREEHQNRNTRNTLEHKGITDKSEETRRDNKSEQQIKNPKSETTEAVAVKLCCVLLHCVLPSQERRRQRWRSSVVFFFILFFRGFLFFVVRSLRSSGLFVSILALFLLRSSGFVFLQVRQKLSL